jgi:hypothetical protein
MNDSRALACSLSPDEQAERGDELRELARRALSARDRKGNAIVLTYQSDPKVEKALRSVIRREAECCPFLDFELLPGERELALRVSAPAGAEAMLDLLYESSAP